MRPGQRIAGRYRIGRAVGEGGMGSVFEATDEIGRKVAIKTLRRPVPVEGDSSDGLRGCSTHQGIQRLRFHREIEALTRLRHEAIVHCFDHGTTDEGRPFLVLEWLDGHDLAERLAEGRLSVPATRALASRLLAALDEAHRAGVVHRDVKPGNVFLVGGDPGRPKLLDFGLARIQQGNADCATVTVDGSLVGTPAYLAPEQARGEALDGRSDLFSFGCLLFECLSGRRAFRGENPMAVLAKVLLETPPDVSSLRPGIPAWLSIFVSTLLAKDPARRPKSAARALEALHRRDSVSDLSDVETTEQGGRQPAADTSTLTGDEQRLVSVVLTAADRAKPSPGESGETSLQDELEETNWRLGQHGGQMQVLATGDLVLVVDGAGVATDRVRLAVRSALELARALPGTRISVATGRGRFEGSFPVGEVIDRAGEGLRRFRHQMRDRPGDPLPVAIDDLTTGLLDGRFEIEGGDHGLFLTRERRGGGPARSLLGRKTPFVGRERELRMLDALLDSATAGEGAQVAVVTGIPGAGKSRLAAEQIDRWRQAGREVWCGQADVMRSGAAWSLLAAVIAKEVGAPDGEDDEVRSRKLRARLGRHLPAADADRVAPFLAEVIGVRGQESHEEVVRARHDRELMADRIRTAWIDWLSLETRARPLVVVLEDVQWGDLPTIRVFDAAMRVLADRPFFVAAFARPDIADRFPNLWHECRPTRIELQRLPRRAATSLTRQMLGDRAPADEVERLVVAADGNPFFLEELIRSHAEGRRDGAPATLRATVQVRLEELEPEQRKLLRAASVFGLTFWHGGVEKLVGGDISSARFRRLEELELVERRTHSGGAGTMEYSFRHDLVREAAYASLTPDDRILGHRLAGEWLEIRQSSPAVLLEHFRRADETSKIVSWLPRAADAAFEAHDFDTAVRLADEAVEHVRGRKAGNLHLLCAVAQRWRGDWSETQRRAEIAGELLEAGSAEWFRASAEAMTAAARRGHHEVARLWQSRVASTAALVSDRAPDGTWSAGSARISALALASRQVFHAGEYEEAERLASLAESIAARAGAPDGNDGGECLEPGAWANLHRLRGARARHVGDLAGDLRGYCRALEACEKLGDVRQAANVRVSLGFGYLEVGDQTRAEAFLSQGLREARRMGLESVVTRARQNQGLALIQRGDGRSAVGILRQVIDEAREQGNLRFVGWTSVYLSQAYLLIDGQGPRQSSESVAREAVGLLIDSPPARAGAEAALSRSLLAQQYVPEARLAAAAAFEVLETHGGIEEFESLVWLAWLEALQAEDDDGFPEAVQRAAERLGRRTAALGDRALEASFLSGVPENRALLRLFRAQDIKVSDRRSI
ncbi:MAG: protein kinase [Thermoanaerobaculia bacterium]|nr:protein kinase [Thermoanaerobaculia bacterium]